MKAEQFVITDDVAVLESKHGRVTMDWFDLVQMKDCTFLPYTKRAKEGNRNYCGCIVSRGGVYLGSLARVLLNAPDGMEADHINHDPLDNRRANLRLCTRSENARNTRGHSSSKNKYKGVTYHTAGHYPAGRRWRAYTRVNGKRVWLGYHATEDDAARAYNDYAIKEFGEFACLNDVPASV
mgnify:CR=1 FL=1